MNWSQALPPRQNEYRGHRASLYFLVLIGLRDVFRSSVHYFAPDGGSGLIAGLPLESYSHDAVMAIVNGFGVYGIAHILQAILVWVVILRCRAWIPFLCLLLLISQILAVILFQWKPLPVVPPGQIGVYVLLPLSLLFFLASLREAAAPVGERDSNSSSKNEEVKG